MATLRPTDAAQVAAMVQHAAAARRTLEVVGKGSRRQFGHPVRSDDTLDLSALSTIVSYEHDELVLTAQAAAPLEDIKSLLSERNQYLAFEPPDLADLWGQPKGEGTLGGALATGLGGPRRASAGAPRDHFLGFKAVNGLGQSFSAGGKVVKNVTGYDLPKLMAGSFGTLCVMTEVTVKVLPAPPETRTLAIYGLDEQGALTRLRSALGGPVAVTGAAFLPIDIVAGISGPMAERSGSAALLRLEGVEQTVRVGVSKIIERVGQSCSVAIFNTEDSQQLWQEIGNAHVFAESDLPVWRFSIPPSTAASVGDALRRSGASRLYFDWGGGSVWAEGPGTEDGGAVRFRSIATEAGGHVVLMRAARELHDRVDVFQPLEPGLLALTARIKERFDPFGLFNPGRVHRSL
jgi:glycolate oxidase FAD binding subunit